MEMYADPDARGGVLEPEGTVEIRFRQKDLIKTMSRCDGTYKKLMAEVSAAGDAESRQKIDLLMREREAQLIGMYHQVALSFADLHDKPQRMLQKECICDIIVWNKSRYQLYWRLRRLLYEDRLKCQIRTIFPEKDDGHTKSMIRRWFIEQYGQHQQYLYEDNRCVSEWLHSQLDTKNSQINENLTCLKREALNQKLQKLFTEDPNSTFQSIISLLQSDFSVEQRVEIKSVLDSNLPDMNHAAEQKEVRKLDEVKQLNESPSDTHSSCILM